MRPQILKVVNPLIFPALLVAIWGIWVSANKFNSIVMPSPAAVFQDAVSNSDAYFADLGSTLLVTLIGMAIGIALAWAFACLGWMSAVFYGFMTPLALVLTTIPIVALIPILVRIFGYGSGTIIAIVAILSFLQTYILVSRGLRHLPGSSNDLAACYGASKLNLLVNLAIPNAVPALMTSIRVASGLAIGATLVAEFLMGLEGTGANIRKSKDMFDTERAFGLAIGAAAISVLLYAVATVFERRIAPRYR